MGPGPDNSKYRRKVTRLYRVKEYLDDKQVRYQTRPVRKDAKTAENRQQIIRDHDDRRRERNVLVTLFFIIVMLIFVLAIVKLTLFLKNSYFSVDTDILPLELKTHRGASARGRVDGNTAVMQLHDPAAEAQADPGSPFPG